jgi:hypothetical protein
VGEIVKKLRPAATTPPPHRTRESLLACRTNLRTHSCGAALGAAFSSLSALSLAKTRDGGDEVSKVILYIFEPTQPNTTHIRKTPWLCPPALWTTVAGLGSHTRTPALAAHDGSQTALRAALETFPTHCCENLTTQTPNFIDTPDNCRNVEL